MKTPDLTCTVKAYCPIFPSEDPKKVKICISNILSETDFRINNDSIFSSSKKISSLENIYEIIHSKKNQKIYRKQLNRNLRDDHTWIYLNKQAAYVGTLTLCENEDESPLGPIKISIESKNIERIIEWLISD